MTRSAQVPVAGQLRVTADEAVVFSFLSAGPGLPRIAKNNAECGLAHLFSAACVNQASERVREESERDRSVYVGALAVMLGSPHGRLYYTTALLTPQRLNGHAATMSHGLGTGYSNLPRTKGGKRRLGESLEKRKMAPDAPPSVSWRRSGWALLLQSSWCRWPGR